VRRFSTRPPGRSGTARPRPLGHRGGRGGLRNSGFSRARGKQHYVMVITGRPRPIGKSNLSVCYARQLGYRLSLRSDGMTKNSNGAFP